MAVSAHLKIDTGRMTSKGQVLIPKWVRDAIGLAPNAPYKITVNAANNAEISPIGDGPEDAEARESIKSIIADFLIGGHAFTLGATILTRDPRFYRTYFPSVPLITPDKAEP